MHNVHKFIIFTLLFFSARVLGAQRTQYYDNQYASVAVKENRDALVEMRHVLDNHETEIHIFDERLKNLDSIIDSLRDQLSEMNDVHKDQLKGNSAALSAKISTLDMTTQHIVADMKQFKTYAQDTSNIIAQYNKKINELETVVDIQNKNIEHLQAAINVLMEVLQGKEAPSAKVALVQKGMSVSGGSYTVKSGDNLEKIARAHQTTVQAIKELNGMANDKIVVGKVLQIPEK